MSLQNNMKLNEIIMLSFKSSILYLIKKKVSITKALSIKVIINPLNQIKDQMINIL